MLILVKPGQSEVAVVFNTEYCVCLPITLWFDRANYHVTGDWILGFVWCEMMLVRFSDQTFRNQWVSQFIALTIHLDWFFVDNFVMYNEGLWLIIGPWTTQVWMSRPQSHKQCCISTPHSLENKFMYQIYINMKLPRFPCHHCLYHMCTINMHPILFDFVSVPTDKWWRV